MLLRQRLDDPVLNTTISFAVPFLAYFPAEEVDASGVLAVVVAGLVTGTLGSRRFSARDRQTQAITWTTISFILESGVFLAMGYQLPELIDAARGRDHAQRDHRTGPDRPRPARARCASSDWPGRRSR